MEGTLAEMNPKSIVPADPDIIDQLQDENFLEMQMAALPEGGMPVSRNNDEDKPVEKKESVNSSVEESSAASPEDDKHAKSLASEQDKAAKAAGTTQEVSAGGVAIGVEMASEKEKGSVEYELSHLTQGVWDRLTQAQQLEERPDPLLSDANQSSRDQIALPGAYAEGPSFDAEGRQGGHLPSVNVAAAHQDLATTSNNNNNNNDGTVSDNGLAVAQPVDEASSLDLPLAQAHDGSQSQNKQNPCGDHDMKHILCVMVLIILPIAVFLIVFIPDSDAVSSATPEGGDVTDTPQAIPLSQEDHLISVLPDDTLEALEDPTSPQTQALQWITDDPYLTTYSTQQVVQRFSLASLYYSLQGHGWARNDNWLSYNRSECEWYQKEEFGVTSMIHGFYNYWAEDYLVPTPNSPCDSEGRIRNVWLDRNNVVGSLPEELYLLSNLQSFSFAMNPGLEGTLSTRLGTLQDLEAIVFLGMGNPGPIPSEIGMVTKMKAMGLSIGAIGGTLPSELGLLTDMEYMALGNNPDLGGTIPTNLNMSKVIFFALLESDFTGTIPTELATQLQSVKHFSLGKMRLSGTVPTELGLLSTIEYFNLEASPLMTGTLPSELGQLERAKTFKLENSHFSGSLPEEIFNIETLQRFWAFNSTFTGTIPSGLDSLSNLIIVDLSNNLLTGPIPQVLTNGSLYSFDVHGNAMLSGTVPEGLCDVKNTCVPEDNINTCNGIQGLTFDCTNALCGCHCPCQA